MDGQLKTVLHGLTAVLHRMTYGAAANIIDGEVAQAAEAAGPFEDGTIGQLEHDARLDLIQCRREIDTLIRSCVEGFSDLAR